jgi:hypothetical protein
MSENGKVSDKKPTAQLAGNIQRRWYGDKWRIGTRPKQTANNIVMLTLAFVDPLPLRSSLRMAYMNPNVHHAPAIQRIIPTILIMPIPQRSTV